MLHPQTVELMEYAKMAAAKVGLITNAYYLTLKKARRLLEADVDMIECSVDAGNASIYRKVRPGLDWKIVVKNIKQAVSVRNKIKSRSKIIVSIVNQKGVDVDDAKNFWRAIVDEVQVRKYLTWDIVKNKSADQTPYLSPRDKIPCPHLF